MLISDSKANEIINTLQNARDIHLIDNDINFKVDDNGIVTRQNIEEFGRITFPISSSIYYDLFENFKKEFTNNKYVTGFNGEFYCNQVIRECDSIKKHFETLNINGVDVRLRDDAIFKHYKIGEVETTFDIEGNPFDVPYPIVLSSVPWEELKNEILMKMSEYFNYQGKVLDIILKFLQTGYQKIHITRPYRSSYSYNYFKFDMDKLGIKEEAKENIDTFFNELIEKKYVDSESPKSLVDLFNDIPSKNKVRWLRTKTELWYLIKRMVQKGYLEDPKRVTAKIISKVFTRENGKDFIPEDFSSLHKPQNTKELNDLVAILGPSGR